MDLYFDEKKLSNYIANNKDDTIDLKEMKSILRLDDE